MKKLFVMALLFMAATGWSTAQDGAAMRTPRTPEQRAEMQTRHLTKSLALSTDQQTQVKAIILSRAVQMDSLRTQTTLDKTERMAQMKAAKDASDADMQKVLSADQYQKYLQMQDDRMEKMQQKRQGRRSN
jgi:hypothetical protein